MKKVLLFLGIAALVALIIYAAVAIFSPEETKKKVKKRKSPRTAEMEKAPGQEGYDNMTLFEEDNGTAAMADNATVPEVPAPAVPEVAEPEKKEKQDSAVSLGTITSQVLAEEGKKSDAQQRALKKKQKEVASVTIQPVDPIQEKALKNALNPVVGTLNKGSDNQTKKNMKLENLHKQFTAAEITTKVTDVLVGNAVRNMTKGKVNIELSHSDNETESKSGVSVSVKF